MQLKFKALTLDLDKVFRLHAFVKIDFFLLKKQQLFVKYFANLFISRMWYDLN